MGQSVKQERGRKVRRAGKKFVKDVR